MTPEEQFQTDPVFNRVVQLLEGVIAEAQLTPFEIRQAAMLACIRYEMRNPRFLLFDPQVEKPQPDSHRPPSMG